MKESITTVKVIDSHTAGEPTRLIIGGGPSLGPGTMAERLQIFRSQFDRFRSAVVNEPRGSDAVVGALLCEPVDRASSAGVIFFNNVGYLGMCGHGTIGLIVTLAYMGRIKPGKHQIETPAGNVIAELHPNDAVTVNNVPSRRTAAAVAIDVPGHGRFTGDVAWGGNWFFLVREQRDDISISNIDALTQLTTAIRHELARTAITGTNGEEIDHIELFGPPSGPDSNSKNFVLCPGCAYDRSPCGTGTSAKMACLYADGKLKPGEIWRQEGVVGGIFEGRVAVENGQILPSITGTAFVTAEADLILDQRDPLRHGIPRPAGVNPERPAHRAHQ
ncbi:MAG TPA: proline racemase family protein [Terriglobales bacterium]|nr:proline racemase family protein [Terriglobales bacterium]